MPLYNVAIPNSISTPDKETSNANNVHLNVTQPTLGIYLPSKETANGTAVIICPGGGYQGLWMSNEGRQVAENMSKLGVAAFVLKYRLPSDVSMKDKSIGPLQDAQRAIQVVRERASEWNIDPNKIGIMGFSAGGHLASTAETHFDKSYIDIPKQTSLRPDFAILVYPVISFQDSLTHFGSRNALIGKDPSEENVRLFSNELQVTPQTPPTFLIQAEDDKTVSVKNIIVFFLALLKDHVPAGLHIFPTGGHGFPLEPAHSNWFSYCASWLKENGWLKK
ncbi:MAG: alpha/beta hydrolase [Bacteroidota bacterium]|nr:alpha/beta hydrolase [Bacteroidota bacterium]